MSKEIQNEAYAITFKIALVCCSSLVFKCKEILSVVFKILLFHFFLTTYI